MEIRFPESLPLCPQFSPTVPVRCATPYLDGCLHRFFDTSPISPSGRYLAVTRFRHEDRLPTPLEPADVVVVDLTTGSTTTVAETRGFETQLGAQVQWGATDRELFFNDIDTTRGWRPFGVRLDPATGQRQKLGAPVYMVSRDGRLAASPCLLRTGVTQYGYGVLAPLDRTPWNIGAVDDDGVTVTDTQTGEARLIASFRDIADAIGGTVAEFAQRADGGLYGFHVKWNVQSTRLMFVVRFKGRNPGEKARAMVVTMAPDGDDVRLAMPAELWSRGGHHPDWCPDGENILMNLKLDGRTMRFVRFQFDGAGLEPLTEAVEGSGHPTLHPDGRHVFTDEYATGRFADKDGVVPLRWVDVQTGKETVVARIPTNPCFAGPGRIFRVDPHPAWDRTYRYVAFNAAPDGIRRVYVADMAPLLEA